LRFLIILINLLLRNGDILRLLRHGLNIGGLRSWLIGLGGLLDIGILRSLRSIISILGLFNIGNWLVNVLIYILWLGFLLDILDLILGVNWLFNVLLLNILLRLCLVLDLFLNGNIFNPFPCLLNWLILDYFLLNWLRNIFCHVFYLIIISHLLLNWNVFGFLNSFVFNN